MKTFLFLSFLLVACSGKTVQLESSSDTSQPLCARWEASFCNSGLPEANTLEAIRLIEQTSVDAIGRLDSACLNVVAAMNRPTPVQGVDALATVKADCALAHELLEPVLGGIRAVSASCLTPGPSFGCVPSPDVNACPMGIVVDDQNGKYALEAEAARGSLLPVFALEAELEYASRLTGTVIAELASIAHLDDACRSTAVSKMGASSDRISTVASVASALLAP